METNINISKTTLWVSYILSGIVSVMFLMSSMMNLTQSEVATKGALDMGYPKESMLYLGLLLLTSTILYLYPKTSVLGAIFLTNWLGGAVATHVIHKDSLGMTFMPILFGCVVWIALWLRNADLKKIFPIKA